MARYFQHLNENNDDFQEVTKLERIDNSDPNGEMYYFEDGTKCYKEYIGAIGEDAYGIKEFVEVTSPENRWRFRVKEPEVSGPITATNADGVEVTIADPYSSGRNRAPKKQVAIVSRPSYVPYTPEPDEHFYTTNSGSAEYISGGYDFNEAVQTNRESLEEPAEYNAYVEAPMANTGSFDPYAGYNAAAAQPQQKPVAKQPVKQPQQRPTTQQAKQATQTNTTGAEFTLDAETLTRMFSTVHLKYNGKEYDLPIADFFKNAVTPPEEKIVETVVEVEKEIETDGSHIKIGLDATQLGLANNMIDQCQKKTCNIDIALGIKIPPKSVYTLIKTVYPEGMAKGFVNIIADRMDARALKSAVAQGLTAYYDDDASVEIVEAQEPAKADDIEEVIPETVETNTPKKRVVRKKTA